MSGAVLVAGGAGYIGSHVCKALADAGSTPVCYDTLEKGHQWAVRWGPLEEGRHRRRPTLAGSLRQAPAKGVVHLAGYIEVGESVQLPERYLYNNAVKTDFLIAAAVRAGVEAFVFSSSCAVYGLPQSEFLAETHQIAPISPYAESKARGERRYGVREARDCARPRCATSTPPAPTRAATSAKRTNPRRTCFRSLPTPHSASDPLSPCWATTTTRPTARACATSSMSATSPMPICGRSPG